jgi:hypothetical protein
MLNYVFNLGLDSAKIMNVIYSMDKINISLQAFLNGNSLVLDSKIIQPVKAGLPLEVAGLTGPLFLQDAIIKQYENNQYSLYSGSYDSSIVLRANDSIKYTKFSSGFSGSQFYFTNGQDVESVSYIDGGDYTPSFYLSAAHFNDGTNIVYFDYKAPQEARSNFIGYSADSYGVNFGQTDFGQILSNYLYGTNYQFAAQSASLYASFKDMAEACAAFSEISYSKENVYNNLGEYSNNIIDAFDEFAGINLNV